MQTLAIKHLAEQVKQGQQPVISKAMAAAGYAESTAKAANSKLDINEPHLAALFKKELPKSFLTKTIKSQFKARTIKSVEFDGKNYNPIEAREMMEEQGFKVINVKAGFGKVFVTYFDVKHDIVDKTLEKAIKVYGDYAPEQIDVRSANIDVTEVNDKLSQLEAMRNRYVNESENEIAEESDELE